MKCPSQLEPETRALVLLLITAVLWGAVALLSGCRTAPDYKSQPEDGPDAPRKVDAAGHPNYGPAAWPRSTP